MKGTSEKFWFNCTCGHEFESIIANICYLNRWCPYCTHQKLCGDDNCNSCFNNSFASHEKSIFWSDKNDVKPRNVFKSSSRKYWFRCNSDHIFEIFLYSIVAGKWCSQCHFKTEAKLQEQLKEKYDTLKTQFKKPWCKKSKCYHLILF